MSNFDFLAGNWTELARMGELAEQYLYSDTNTCLHMMELRSLHMTIRMQIELGY